MGGQSGEDINPLRAGVVVTIAVLGMLCWGWPDIVAWKKQSDITAEEKQKQEQAYAAYDAQQKANDDVVKAEAKRVGYKGIINPLLAKARLTTDEHAKLRQTAELYANALTEGMPYTTDTVVFDNQGNVKNVKGHEAYFARVYKKELEDFGVLSPDAPVLSPTKDSAWYQYVAPDTMGKGDIKTAQSVSLGTFEFGFPYAGEQYATLSLRHHPRWGSDAILSVERGQFECDVEGCSVTARFDNRASETFKANAPRDGSTTSLSIKPFDKFLRRLKAAKTVAIEAEFYREGVKTFTFNCKGLKW